MLVSELLRSPRRAISGLVNRVAMLPKASQHQCPVCESNVREWLPGSKQGNKRYCPVCFSKSRQRLVWLALKKNKVGVELSSDSKVLHVAPEASLMCLLDALLGDNYFPCDISPDRPGIKYSFPVEAIPFPSRHFDLIICNHVLEHVDSFQMAMTEFGRVLKMDGVALVTIPVEKSLRTTYEDSSITDPKQREIHFGQWDHVRKFGADAAEELSQLNIKVEALSSSEVEPDQARFGLKRHERLFVGRPVDCSSPT